VEATLANLSEAYRRGDNQAIAEALIEQVQLLQALGIKFLTVAGGEKLPKCVEMYSGLGLRALEQARKALMTLHALRDSKPRRQTNVQVNLGGGLANEVFEVDRGE
jgi:hypothetical protein